LHVTGLRAAGIAHAVFMADGALAYIGDDFHILVRMRAKPHACRDGVVINDAQRAKAHAFGVVVIGKTEVMPRIQPAMYGMAKLFVWVMADHKSLSFPGSLLII